jgi:citrate lyase subunit beta / citryl-CoA lyase
LAQSSEDKTWASGTASNEVDLVTTFPCRSALFVPVSNTRAIAKVRSLACDCVILDLEDAVAPDVKATARRDVVAAVRQGLGAHRVIVRINGLDTPWGREDLAAAVAARPDAILLPKLDKPEKLVAARAEINDSEIAIWAMIETCRAVLSLGKIVDATADTGLAALVAGTNDLASEMRCRPDSGRTAMLYALSSIVMAARSSGLIALDGVCNHLDDEDIFAQECAQGRTLGFDGKTLIHPGQIDIANDVFSPSLEEVAFAQAVVAGFDDPTAHEKGAIRIQGRMVELLHLEQCRQVLAYSKRLAAPFKQHNI